MAVRTATDNGARKTWLIALSLVALFAIALFLRAYWNLDAATEGGDYVLSGGSDPYYHKHAIDYILSDKDGNGRPDFETLQHDPMLNYPYGAINPNPPLYEWSVAVSAQMITPFTGGDLAEAAWIATIWSPAVFGALTVIPVYLIGAALFDRRVGLVAALFWTISTSAIDATGLGDADHDAAIMFFASLAFLFYIKAVQGFRGDRNWVADWRKGETISPGLAAFFRGRRAALGYALLAGISIGAVALIWKGFPYVIGVLYLYAGLQMVIDHWRNKDSTGLFIGTFLAMTLGTLIALPYYAEAGVANFLRPVWFILGSFLIGGLVLVPTRDLPTLLVFPATVVIAILGAIVAFFVVPDVARGLLYATVYFKQTALYETIAEAHPADFSSIVFGIGPLQFFLALAGWITLMFSVRRHPTRAILFTVVWGAVALFMANSAIRFLFNAIPIFAVLAAFMTVWVIDWLNFATIRKSLAANEGSFWTGFRKGMRPMQIIGVFLIVLLVAIPSAILAADAALPPENEQRIAEESESRFVKDFVQKRLGAYGQGFIPAYWHDGLTWLSQQDANLPPEDRPAFLAWWDYGHWAIAVGDHPAVADNFQNGYEYAANFILAQSEEHAIQLLGARLVDLPNANAEQALADAGVANPSAALAQLRAFKPVDNMTMQQSLDFLETIEGNTGKKIRYFAADVRMLPVDDTNTPSVDQSSIFYAPAKLAAQNPDDYVQVVIQATGGSPITASECGIPAASEFLTTEQFRCMARNPIQQIQGTGERLHYSEKFFNSMYWRAYTGTPARGPFPVTGDQVIQGLNDPRPGEGFEHFRLAYANEGVKILEFYRGATVRGTVVEAGAPVTGATVTVLDDAGMILFETFTEEAKLVVDPARFNAAHDSATTDSAGAFELTAPFGSNLTIVAEKDGVELARTNLAVTRAEAEAQKEFTVALTLEPGAVEGVVFEDMNANSRYDEANDTLLPNLNVTIAGQSATSDAEGRYSIRGIPAGSQNVTVDDAQYRARVTRVLVSPGAPTAFNVSVELRPATVSGAIFVDLEPEGGAANGEMDDGEELAGHSITFTADGNVTGNRAQTVGATSDSTGAYSATLQPGTYIVKAVYRTNDGVDYAVESSLVVAVGETKPLTLRLERVG